MLEDEEEELGREGEEGGGGVARVGKGAVLDGSEGLGEEEGEGEGT